MSCKAISYEHIFEKFLKDKNVTILSDVMKALKADECPGYDNIVK